MLPFHHNSYSFVVKAVCYFLCVAIHAPIQSIVVGSDSAPYRSSFVTFPETDSDNEIRGFVSLDEGFSLQSNQTTCLFNGFESIKTQIILNQGNVTLQNNLMLDNVSTITSIGSLQSSDGTVKSFMLADNTKTFGADSTVTVTFENIEFVMKRNLTLGSSIAFIGDCRITGNGYTMTLSDGVNFLVESDSVLTIQDLILNGVQDQNIRCLHDESSIHINNVNWIFRDDFMFDKGSLLFSGDVFFSGNAQFTYETAYTSTIQSDSRWGVVSDLFLIIGKHPIAGTQPLYFEDSSSIVWFDKSSFQITNQGMQLTRGKAIFNNNVAFEYLSTDTTNGVMIGDGTVDNDFIIEFNAAAVLNFDQGHFVYNNTIVDGVRSKAKTSRVNRTPNSHIYNLQSQVLSNFTFNYSSILVPPIDVLAGKTVSFSNIDVVFPDFAFTINAQQYSSVAELLLGNNSVALQKGIFPLALLILNSGNSIQGNGTIGGPIQFLSSASSLVWANLGPLSSQITFNGAELSLKADLSMNAGASLVGPGSIDLQNYRVKYPLVSHTQSSSLVFNGDGEIDLRANFIIDGDILCNGECLINGQNHVLSMGAGSLIVGSQSKLILQDIIIDGIKDENIRCQDDTGIIEFDNARCTLSSYYTFSSGAMRLKNKNYFGGDEVLAYETVQTSTILSQSSLQLEGTLTFSYAPRSFDKSLIFFSDKSSELKFNEATLLTTSSGIDFYGGTIRIRGTSTFAVQDSTNIIQEQNISFGNGETDITVLIDPGVELYVSQGVLAYKNISIPSFRLLNNESALHIGTGAVLALFEDLTITTGFIIFDDLARLYSGDGIKEINGSINPQGNLIRRNFAL